MPLPTNYSRPSLPYQPLQSLPNDQRFVILTTLQQPPTAEMFDAELNAVLDKINILAGAINGVVAGNIPGSDNPDNAGKFLVTDGAGNLSFIFVNSDNISAGAISTLLLQDQAVIRAKIGNGAVGTLQLAEGAVTADILADGAVTGNKIPPGSLPLSKLIIPASACLIGGTTTGGGAWYSLTLGDWQIAAKRPQNNGPTAVSLVDVWSGTNGTFDGGKITAATLALGKLISSQQSSLIAGTPLNNAYYEVVMGDWQVAVKRAQDNSPTGRTLDIIWANTVNTFDGGKLTGASVPFSAIVSQQQPNSFAPFCMAYVYSNGTVQKSLNLGSLTRTGTGYYTVRFNTPANDNKYVVVFGNDDTGGLNVSNAYVAQNSRTVNGFDVQIWDQTRQGADEEFNFVVYAW